MDVATVLMLAIVVGITGAGLWIAYRFGDRRER